LIDVSDETSRLTFATKDEVLLRLAFPYPAEVFDETRPSAFFSSAAPLGSPGSTAKPWT
jgi:hypothetical protein